ncbi:PREDICTED: coiled-coil domain-containing protein 113 [Cyprinodon variegatus]|uniref:coiled-coil domain-containing protein 113 n=1 Tax=Cyprinodon variegatus TaxID=28743 RepID=UPI000742771C|nr:PREDICTED: coiled-coil domain-containing protein 113 [Cyprinodon variegatus]
MEDELLIEAKEEYLINKQKQLLRDQIKELRCSNEALRTENVMFENFIRRLIPQDLVSKTGGDSPQSTGDSKLYSGEIERGQRPLSNLSEVPQLLTLEQKLYVAQREVTETQQDMEKLKTKYERILENYKSSLKESELRLNDIKKVKNDFEIRFFKPTKDSHLEMPENILQHIEDKSKVTQLEKFYQKNRALKVQEIKLLQQLQEKKETSAPEYGVGEKVFVKEFSELQMDINLNELQDNSSKVQRLLSSHKEKLHCLTLESSKLTNDITKGKERLAKLEEEIQHAEKECLKAEGLNQLLCKELRDYQCPQITEYVYAKEKHKKLQQSVHLWERKVGIAEMALRTHNREWRKQRDAPTNCTEAGSQQQISVKLPYIGK